MEERPGPFVLGDRVEARLRGKSHWYPAEVVNVEAEAADDDDCAFLLLLICFTRIPILAHYHTNCMAVRISSIR